VKITLGSILLITGIIILASVTFFIYTTKTSSPTTMNLYIPKDSEKDSVDQFSGVKTKLTLILLKDDKVFGYYGDFIKGGRSVALDETGKLIDDGWKMFSKDSLVVVIKPTEEASYKATVDILDQMTKKQIKKYSMTDLDKKEKGFLKING